MWCRIGPHPNCYQKSSDAASPFLYLGPKQNIQKMPYGSSCLIFTASVPLLVSCCFFMVFQHTGTWTNPSWISWQGDQLSYPHLHNAWWDAKSQKPWQSHHSLQKKKTQKIHQYHYRPASSCASQSPSWKHPGLRKGLQDMSLDGSVHPSHDSVRKLRNLDSRVRRFLDSQEKMPTVGQLFIQTSWNSSISAMDVWYSWFIMIHDINWLVRWIFHQKKSGRSGCIQDRLLWQSIQAGTNVKTSQWMAWGNDWGKNHGIVRGWFKVENPSKYFLQSIVVIQDADLITETTQASYSS